MWGLFLGGPVTSSGPYDADAPEGARGLGSQYITRKDIYIIGGALVVVGLLCIPLFRIMKEQSDRTVCKRNMQRISMSLQQYAEVFDGRYPPAYHVGGGGGPQILNGMPVVWASVLPGLPEGSSFACPAATPEEAVRVNGESFSRSMFSSEVKRLPYIDLTYGMFIGLSARAVSDVAFPDQTVLLAETSNNGSRGVFNPVPFMDGEGQAVPFDGFTVGYDTGGIESTDETRAMTRLSFYGTESGDFEREGIEARHNGFIYVIRVDGSLGQLRPTDALYDRTGYAWRVR